MRYVAGHCCCGSSSSGLPRCEELTQLYLYCTVTGPQCALGLIGQDLPGGNAVLEFTISRDLGRTTCEWLGTVSSGIPDDCRPGGRGYGLVLRYDSQTGLFTVEDYCYPATCYASVPGRISDLVPVSFDPLQIEITYQTNGVNDCCRCPSTSAGSSASGDCDPGPFEVTIVITE